jgi:hypothetical protein
MGGLNGTGQLARTARLAALSLLLVCLAMGVVHGTTFRPKDFDQLVVEAEQILVGTVTAMQARKEPTGVIVTEVTFANPRIVKGPDVGATTLTVLGGTVGLETLKVGGVPSFQMGMRYLVFMAGNGAAIFPVVGGDQGLFQVMQDPASGADLLLNAYGAPVQSQSVRQAMRPSRGQQSGALPPPAPILLDEFLHAVMERLQHQ